MDEFDLLYGWLPAAAREAFRQAWINDTDTAWQVVRQDSRYETWFPGNKTEDGRVRISEENYAITVTEYDDAFRAVGIDPDGPASFRSMYGDLIRGEVKADELYTDRLAPMYDRIVASSQSIRQYYADTYGIANMTPEAYLAGVLDPDLGTRVLAGQIGIAEIGGEALESGFDISASYAKQLYETGVGRQQADEVFRAAESAIPTLQVLAQRHDDPNDTFDINNFSEAMFFSDPTQLRRIRRLQAQESSLFSNSTSQTQYRRANDTGLAGLEQL